MLFEGASYNFRNRDRGTEVPMGIELDFLPITITIFFLLSHSPANSLQTKSSHIILLAFFLAQVNRIKSGNLEENFRFFPKDQILNH
jgi:hypothetical protein